MSSAARPVRVSPVERFLGPEALVMGPIGLLGLSPETCTDDRIVTSLEWQLDRVSQHAEGDTPEADEVRLALHAAAAQLLDKNVRRHVLSRFGVTMSDAPAATPSETPANPGQSLEQDAILTLAMYGGWNQRSLARLSALAHARGMSSAALAESLQHLATKRRKPPAAKSAPVPTARPHQSAAATPTATNRASALPDAAPTDDHTMNAWQDAESKRHIRNFVLGICGGFVVLAALTVYLIILVLGASKTPPPATTATAPPATGPAAPSNPIASAPAPNPARTPEGQTPAPASPTDAAPGADKTATAPTKPNDATRDQGYIDPLLVVRTLRDAASTARTDAAGALPKFTGALDSLMSRWCRFDPQQRRAADAAVIDFLYAVSSNPTIATSALEKIVQAARRVPALESASTPATERERAQRVIAPRDVWPTVWAVGFLTRASRERELAADLAREIDSTLTAAIGADRPRLEANFENGATPALRRIPAALVRWYIANPSSSIPPATPDAPLATWIEAVTAVAGTDASARERLLADGLEQVLVECPEPRDDKFVFAAIGELAVDIKWRKGGPARARLLAWFKDDRVSASDMQTLTSVLATRSAAEGVDPMMVLSIGAGPADRERLRGLYVKAWGETGIGPSGETTKKWIEAARAEMNRAETLSTELDWLECTVRLAEMNDAATRLWRGEMDAVGSIVENAGVAADAARVGTLTTPVGPAIESSEGDGRWLASYLSAARSIPERLQRLKDLEQSADAIGQADAELLVELGCLETPSEVRAAAQRVVLKYADTPVILNGLLKILPRAPKYPTVSRMIESVVHQPLPKATDPQWEFEARRALVERLLELLASSGDQASINALAGLVWQSYAARSASGKDQQASDQIAAGIDAKAGSDASGAMWREWRDAAEAVSPNGAAPLALDVIDRRHEGRISLASGPIQRFAADQVGIVELMAYVVTAEHADRAKDAAIVISEMASQRRKASHVFEQLVAAEKAMLRLWLIRFEVPL